MTLGVLDRATGWSGTGSLVALALTFGCGKGDRHLASPPTGAEHAPTVVDGCATGIEPLPPTMMHGMSFAHSFQAGGARGYGSASSRGQLEELRGLGVEWISLSPFAFQRRATDTELRSSASLPAGESIARVRAEIRAAHDLGLRVLLKPHVWVEDGTWCGRIAPGGEHGREAWWASYGRFVLAWADLAREEGVELFAVGTELGSMVSGSPDLALDLVLAVRAAYPGRLVYAANWDEVGDVPLWPAVDFVGVQLYAPLARALPTADSAMEENLGRVLDQALGVAARTGRPLLVTEVGYTATREALLRPHAWPEDLAHARADPDAQARAFRVAMRSVAARPGIAGLFVWKWFTDPDTAEEGAVGFSPRGRPAAAVLASAFAAPRCARR